MAELSNLLLAVLTHIGRASQGQTVISVDDFQPLRLDPEPTPAVRAICGEYAKPAIQFPKKESKEGPQLNIWKRLDVSLKPDHQYFLCGVADHLTGHLTEGGGPAGGNPGNTERECSSFCAGDRQSLAERE